MMYVSGSGIRILAIALAWASLAQAQTCSEAFSELRVSVSDLLALGKHGAVSRNLNPGGETIILESRGVPHYFKKMNTEGRVFRHYVRSSEELKNILRTRKLAAKKTPYMETDEAYRNTFPDVTGVFFTSPKFSSQAVGLERDALYVDFTFPDGVPAVFLSAGFYLIPGAPLETSVPIRIRGTSPQKGRN